MTMRRLCLLLAAFPLAIAASAEAQPDGSYVQASVVGPATAAPGRAFDLLVRLDIKDGYHIQSADARDPNIPTTVSVTAPKGYKVGKAIYPASTIAEVAGEQLSVYEGRADVKVPITSPASASGKQSFRVAVGYQACNALSCYPPAEAAADAVVDFGGVGASANTPNKAAPAKPHPAPSAARNKRLSAPPSASAGSQGSVVPPPTGTSPAAPQSALLGGTGTGQRGAGYLTVTAALPQRVSPARPFAVRVSLVVKAGFHIQAHKPAPGYIATDVAVTAPAGFRVGAPQYPQPTVAAIAGEKIPVYEGTVTVLVPVTPPAKIAVERPYRVRVRYQACNATSCYPPQEARFTISDKGSALNGTQSTPAAVPSAAAGAAGFTTTRIEQYVPPQEFVAFLKGDTRGAGTGALENLLKRSLWLALPLIFVLGLALNLTPCVYPIIPITISYFGGQAGTAAKQGQKPLTLALFYVLGMAMMYSALGVAAGMTGSLFGSQLQNPWVLAVFAVVMFGLALSQFDRKDGRPIWEMQLPAGLRNRATSRSGVLGAMLMGLLVGVVAAPCIGPAVVALLQWVSTQRSPSLGFASFFTLALGLGAPYVVLATVSGSVKKLPRSGEWMIGVKHIFGVILIWMGVYYLQTILNGLRPGLGQALLVAATALGGLYVLVDRSGVKAKAFTTFRRLLAIAALAAAVWLALPAPPEAIHWQPYSDTAIEQARAANKMVLVDFTANWCAACKELEHKTFSDPAVGTAARDFVALRADMTNWEGPVSQKLKDHYRIVGLPTVVRLAPDTNALAAR